MIYGWVDLQNACNVHRGNIQRWIAFYGFPKGTKVLTSKGRKELAWEIELVAKWLVDNPDLVAKTKGLTCPVKRPEPKKITRGPCMNKAVIWRTR